MDIALTALIALTLLFAFVNGVNDSSSLVGTLISSGALSARRARVIAGVAEFVGAIVVGSAVAATIGGDVIVASAISMRVLLAAIVGAIIWGILAGQLGAPTSATHALIGGLLGAALVVGGDAAVRGAGVAKVFFTLAIGPTIGLALSWLLMRAVLFFARGVAPGFNAVFKRLQIVSAVAVAGCHGANDAQKSMGVITLGLIASGQLATFAVPSWTQAACAAAIALGVGFGGERILRTLGSRVYRIRPVHGFAALSCSAIIVFIATILGGPMSTTQVSTSAIFGVGAADRPSRVRWELGWNIFMAWIVTVPFAALTSALICALLAFL